MPDWRAEVRTHLVGAGLQSAREQEIVEEFAQHLEDRYQDAIARGLSQADASAAARREIEAGGRLAREIASVVTDPASVPPRDTPPPRQWMSGLLQDVRYACRTLRRSPGFFAAATLTVALSTGPTIAALGVANWLFFRPLPGVKSPERMAVVWFGTWSDRGFSPAWVSYPHLADLQARMTTIDAMTGHQRTSVSLAVDSAKPRLAQGMFVMANFFDVLGVQFVEGRGFLSEEDRNPGGETVAVLSADLARSLFPAGSAVGQVIRTNGHAFQIVGVTSPAFRGSVLGEQTDLWMPGLTSPRVNHRPPEEWSYEPGFGPFNQFLVRLAPGATFAQADAELRAAALTLAGESPGSGKYKTVQPFLYPEAGLEPFARGIGWDLTRPLLIVGVVLVVLGAANLANLFVFRSIARGREAAVRRALGASGSRLARLQLAESLVVSGLGALIGVAITAGIKAWLDGARVPGLGGLEIVIDWRLFALALSIAVAVGVALSIAPARFAARTDLVASTGLGSRGATRSGARLGMGLAVVQVALSVMLFIGALLFIQTLGNLRTVDLGVDLRGVSTFTFASSQHAYTPASRLVFYRNLLDRTRVKPGIDLVAVASGLPAVGMSHLTRVLGPAEAARTLGRSNREAVQAATMVRMNEVTPDYFRALGMHFIAGRTFTDVEAYTSGLELGVVLSASLAERLYGTTNAVGRLVTFPALGGDPRHDVPVIGVVNDVRTSPTRPIELVLYGPFAGSVALPSQFFIVRSERAPAEVTRLVQAEVSGLDPVLPISRDRTLLAALDEQLSRQRVNAWALGVLAALGFVLAAVGIHGLVSQVVANRTREFGIRLAIGASRPQIVRLVLRGALLVVALGAPLGLILAGLGSQLVASQLFGVQPLDAAIYIISALALAAVVVLASLGPAWRASRVDPVNVLRVE